MHRKNVVAAVSVAAAVGAAAVFFLVRRSRAAASDIDFQSEPLPPVEMSEPTNAVAQPSIVDPSSITVARGVTVVPSDGWIQTDREAAPSSPNIVVSVFTREGMSEQQIQSGEAPMIILTVEDLHTTSPKLDEYVGRCIATAVEQSLMMSQGRLRPHVEINKPCELGIFRHQLEYVNVLPTAEFRVAIYLNVIGTLGVTVQLLTPNPQQFEGFRSHLDAMAETVRVNIPAPKPPFTDHHYVRQVVHGCELKLHPTWQIASRDPIEVTIPGNSESLKVYSSGALPSSISSQTERECRTIRGVKASFRNGTTVVFSHGSFDVVYQNGGSAERATNFENIAAFTSSLSPSKGNDSSGTFVSIDESLEFAVEPTGYVFVSQLMSSSLIYLPLHNPIKAVGAPPPESSMVSCVMQFERSAPPSIDGWLQQLQLPSSDAKAMQRKIAGHDAILSSEQHPEQPVTLTTIIIPTPSISYCFQWEAETSQWKSFEPKFNSFLKSLKIQ